MEGFNPSVRRVCPRSRAMPMCPTHYGRLEKPLGALGHCGIVRNRNSLTACSRVRCCAVVQRLPPTCLPCGFRGGNPLLLPLARSPMIVFCQSRFFDSSWAACLCPNVHTHSRNDRTHVSTPSAQVYRSAAGAATCEAAILPACA